MSFSSLDPFNKPLILNKNNNNYMYLFKGAARKKQEIEQEIINETETGESEVLAEPLAKSLSKPTSVINKALTESIVQAVEKVEESVPQEFKIVSIAFSEYVENLFKTKELRTIPDKRWIPIIHMNYNIESKEAILDKLNGKNTTIADPLNTDFMVVGKPQSADLEGIEVTVIDTNIDAEEYTSVFTKNKFYIKLQPGTKVRIVGFDYLIQSQYQDAPNNVTPLSRLPYYSYHVTSDRINTVNMLDMYSLEDNKTDPDQFLNGTEGYGDFMRHTGMAMLFSKKYKTNNFTPELKYYINRVVDTVVSFIECKDTDGYSNYPVNSSLEQGRSPLEICDTRSLIKFANNNGQVYPTPQVINLVNQGSINAKGFNYSEISRVIMPQFIIDFEKNEKEETKISKFIDYGYYSYNYPTTKVSYSINNKFIQSIVAKNQYDRGVNYYYNSTDPVQLIQDRIKDSAKRYMKTFNFDFDKLNITKMIDFDYVIYDKTFRNFDDTQEKRDYLISKGVIKDDQFYYNKITQHKICCVHEYNDIFGLSQPVNLFIEIDSGNKQCSICGFTTTNVIEDSWRETAEDPDKHVVSKYYAKFNNLFEYIGIIDTDIYEEFDTIFDTNIKLLQENTDNNTVYNVDTSEYIRVNKSSPMYLMYLEMANKSPNDTYLKNLVTRQYNTLKKKAEMEFLSKINDPKKYTKAKQKFIKDFDKKYKQELFKRINNDLNKKYDKEQMEKIKLSWVNKLTEIYTYIDTYTAAIYSLETFANVSANILDTIETNVKGLDSKNSYVSREDLIDRIESLYDDLNKLTNNNIKPLLNSLVIPNLVGKSDYTNTLTQAVKELNKTFGDNAYTSEYIEILLTDFMILNNVINNKNGSSDKLHDYNYSELYNVSYNSIELFTLVNSLTENERKCLENVKTFFPTEQFENISKTFFKHDPVEVIAKSCEIDNANISDDRVEEIFEKIDKLIKTPLLVEYYNSADKCFEKRWGLITDKCVNPKGKDSFMILKKLLNFWYHETIKRTIAAKLDYREIGKLTNEDLLDTSSEINLANLDIEQGIVSSVHNVKSKNEENSKFTKTSYIKCFEARLINYINTLTTPCFNGITESIYEKNINSVLKQKTKQDSKNVNSQSDKSLLLIPLINKVHIIAKMEYDREYTIVGSSSGAFENIVEALLHEMSVNIAKKVVNEQFYNENILMSLEDTITRDIPEEYHNYDDLIKKANSWNENEIKFLQNKREQLKELNPDEYNDENVQFVIESLDSNEYIGENENDLE